VLCGAAIGAGTWLTVRQREMTRPVAPVDFTTLLQAWEKSTEASFPPGEETPAPLVFPKDHVGHAGTPAEQWDLAVNLASGGRRFAVHFRLDRLGAAPTRPNRPSAWASNEFFRRFLTVTDVSSAQFRPFERYSRATLGLSGYALKPPRIWLDNDSLEWTEREGQESKALLKVQEAGLAAELHLAPVKPMALPEDTGFGNRGWRGYVYPRLQATGNLTIDGQTFPVSGSGWLSHNWGSLPPVGGQIVFNRWFIQFDDGQEIALLQTRRRDGSGEPTPQGVWFGNEGELEPLETEDLTLEATEFGGPYPIVWRLEFPGRRISLTVRPVLEKQELSSVSQTWDGAVKVEGTAADALVRGWGFMELNGY